MTRENIVRKIRQLAAGARGQPSSLLALSDEILYAAYYQMKNGAGNRATARFLQQEYGLSTSENSLQQAIGKLRKKISSLLQPESISGLMDVYAYDKREFLSSPAERQLEELEELEKSYSQLVQQTISYARESGILPTDLHKHVTALTTLKKTRAQLKKDLLAQGTNGDSSLYLEDFERRADRMHAFITNNGQDSEKMIRVANQFILELEKKAITLGELPEPVWHE